MAEIKDIEGLEAKLKTFAVTHHTHKEAEIENLIADLLKNLGFKINNELENKSLETIYKNETRKLRIVIVTISLVAQDEIKNMDCEALIGLTSPPETMITQVSQKGITLGDDRKALVFFVPPNYFYQVTDQSDVGASATIISWFEFELFGTSDKALTQIFISEVEGLQDALDLKLESPIAISDVTNLQDDLDLKLEEETFSILVYLNTTSTAVIYGMPTGSNLWFTSEASAKAYLSRIKNYEVIRFSCHKIQNAKPNQFNSKVRIHNGGGSSDLLTLAITTGTGTDDDSGAISHTISANDLFDLYCDMVTGGAGAFVAIFTLELRRVA